MKLGRSTKGNYFFNELFPLTWVHVCVSCDTVSGNVSVAVNGVVKEVVIPVLQEGDSLRPADLNMVLGHLVIMNSEVVEKKEFAGMISQVNIFSSPLSSERMVAITQGGRKECGDPGDYVSWEEEDWKLTSKARIQRVEALEHPCRPVSKVTVYSAGFQDHSAATNPEKRSGCMEHCQKLGSKSRSPSVQTLSMWYWLYNEVSAITPDISVFGRIWLSLTDEEVETEWKDAYGGVPILGTGADPIDPNVTLTLPWMFTYRDTKFYEDKNCLHWWTDSRYDRCWEENPCRSYDVACPSGCVINTTRMVTSVFGPSTFFNSKWLLSISKMAWPAVLCHPISIKPKLFSE